MKKLFLILFCCAIAATPVNHILAGQSIVSHLKFADYDVFASNATDGQVAVYFTGNDAGLRGYVSPGTAEKFGPIPGGTYSVLISTNATGTRTFTLNGQTVTSSNGFANFTVDVTSNVYITVQ
ncbi:MAG TPA: hypothetical protein VJ720_01115 [Chitinophaga sp.]|nr:hypothetical protein [Chitinophaga sp.]